MKSNLDLTVIILAKNAANTIQATLDSVSWCDRIIVADDASTDATSEIARRLGATVRKLLPVSSFAKKRQQALAFVSTQWVLFIDSDEVVSLKLRDCIIDCLAFPEYDAYSLHRYDYFMGKRLEHGETGATWITRLGRLDKGKWERDVHEVWVFPGAVGRLSGELSHVAHPTIDSFIDKINMYSQLEATYQCSLQQESKMITLCKLLLYPFGKFVYTYFLKRGFLDGYEGLCMSWMMSLHSLSVRIKILERYAQ